MNDIQRKIVRWFWTLVLLPPLFLVLSLLGVWIFADIPSFEELENPDSKLATQVLAEGGELLTTFHIENRSYVDYDELPPSLVQAAVATEDVRFYRHCGIDFISLGRVIFKTLLLQDRSQGGGSTITQQLAKTLYPRASLSSRIPGVSLLKTVFVKFKEWITAVKLERDYTKEEIVDMYLNAVFFGSGAYGIKTAALTFFGKEPAGLTVEEGATLVGMINKPTRYNPVLNPDKSLERRNFVLSRMEKAGYLPKAARDSVSRIPIRVDYQVQDHTAGIAPYFRDMLRRYMRAEEPKRSDYRYREEFSADSLRWADDQLYGWLRKNRKADGSGYNLDKDGLRIHTTLNYKMQRYAEEAVAEHLSQDLQPSFQRDLKYKRNAPFSNDVERSTIDLLMRQARRWSDRYRHMKQAGRSESEIAKAFNVPVKMTVFSWKGRGRVDTVMTPNDSLRYYKSVLRAAFMAVEPSTGRVRAYVGGPDYRYFKYDNVSQSRRQVGSTIKPFLYTLAMQEGMSPYDKVVDVPQTIIVGEDSWTPRSTDKEEWIGQTVTLKWGLTKSSNNISTYLMKQFGPAAMIHLMHKMGISSHIDEVPSICVGSPEISLYDMVSAYNVFPSRGVYAAPIFVSRIEDSQGNVLSEFVSRKREAIGEHTAYTMVDLMRSVIDQGTGTRLRFRYGFKGPIAGKTGTTNDNSDGWFIGYTPALTAGVWVGAEDRQVHFQSVALGQGANMALPIWARFYDKVLNDKTLGVSGQMEFPVPPGYSVREAERGEEEEGGRTAEDESGFYFD